MDMHRIDNHLRADVETVLIMGFNNQHACNVVPPRTLYELELQNTWQQHLSYCRSVSFCGNVVLSIPTLVLAKISQTDLPSPF